MTLYIFDKDSTLVKPLLKARGGTRPPNYLAEQIYYEDVLPLCAKLREDFNTLAVASNQGGVAFGILSEDEARGLVEAAANYIGAATYKFCPYHPQGKIEGYNIDHYTRKPGPGMLQDIMDELGFLSVDTVMIGDGESDQQAAAAAGVRFVSAQLFFDREE